MKADLKAKWVEALRSGMYRQTDGTLYCEGRDAYCCLGVLVREAGLSMDDARETYEVIPIEKRFRNILESMNDNQGATFSEIADWIEANIPAD